MGKEGKSKYADRLGGMKQGFANAQKQAKIMSGDGVVPVAVYTGKVTARLRESRNGNLMANFSFFITDGELQGIPVFDNLIIEHDDPQVAVRGQRDLCRRLSVMGYEFDAGHPGQLEPLLEELSNEAPLVSFKVRHSEAKDGSGRVFPNCDVLELLQQSARTAPAASRSSGRGGKKSSGKGRKSRR